MDDWLDGYYDDFDEEEKYALKVVKRVGGEVGTSALEYWDSLLAHYPDEDYDSEDPDHQHDHVHEQWARQETSWAEGHRQVRKYFRDRSVLAW